MAIKRAEMGNLGNHHGVGNGVMEMIIDWGPGYRRRDIELAKARWSDFKKRRAASRFEP